MQLYYFMDFIKEDQMRALISDEAKNAEKLKRSHVLNPEGFTGHLISVGDNNFEVSNLILAKYPELESELNPKLQRTIGYMHDFAKIGGNLNNQNQEGGDIMHDLEGGHRVLTDDKLGLISNYKGDEAKQILSEIALGISSDYALAEELGIENMKSDSLQDSAAYRLPELFEERVSLIRESAGNGKPISWSKLVYPDTLGREIASYSDLVDIGGGIKSLNERLDELGERYSRWADDAESEGSQEKANYFRHQVGISLSPKFRKRLEGVVTKIENLM